MMQASSCYSNIDCEAIKARYRSETVKSAYLYDQKCISVKKYQHV